MNLNVNNLRIKLNEILNRENNKYFILNDWLHLVKIHPIFLAKYDSENFFLKNILKDFIKNILKIFIYLFSSTNNKLFKNRSYDFLIISHKLNNNYKQNDEDFYYGKIKEYLENNNLKFKFSYLNHSNFCKNDHSFFINECSFWWKLKIFYNIVKTSICFINKYKNKLNKKILLKIFVEFFSIFTFHNFVIMNNLKQINKHNKIKYIVTTFEGFSWERSVYLSQKNLKTKTIGYQHTFISKKNNSILEINNKDMTPDIVFTSGEITRDIFQKKNIFDNVKIFGENKIFKIANKNNIRNKNNILVAPDGVESECVKMMKFIFDFSIKNKNYNFIFRLHPVINFEKLKKKNKIFNQNFSNIVFSEEKLQFDLERSAYCLYRGSTIAFNCILSNVVPIFVNLDNENSLNVFDGLKSIKSIKNMDDFEKLLSMNNIYEDALSFTKKYFHEMKFEILKSL